MSNNYTIGTYQVRLDKIHSGIGIMLNSNNYTTNYTTNNNQVAAKLYYRYTILPGLSVGVDAGLVNLKTTYQYYEVNNNWLMPALYTPNTQETTNSAAFDGGFGILYQLKSVYAGFSIDHITAPQATYIEYSPEGTPIATRIPMLNYSGIAYNWIIGGHIGSKNEGVDVSASYRDFNLNVNISFVLTHFFIGFSALVGNYYNNNMPDAYNGQNAYLALMGGIKAYHKKIKISFACNFNGGTTPYTTAPLEGGISYSF